MQQNPPEPVVIEPEHLGQLMLHELPYEPNAQQMMVIAALTRFCALQTTADPLFILNRYAGTGKTSLTGALVKALARLNVATILLAPTGRAAKVFGNFAGKSASTIHRRIYRHSLDGLWSGAGMLAENNAANAIFIVDEASMISGADGSPDGSGSLLEDLIHYVYSGINCRMIFLGDTAQLPPVGCEVSPAIDPVNLKEMGLRVSRAVMTATVRQASG